MDINNSVLLNWGTLTGKGGTFLFACAYTANPIAFSIICENGTGNVVERNFGHTATISQFSIGASNSHKFQCFAIGY